MKRYIKADAAEDKRQEYRDRRAAAKQRKEAKAGGREIISKIKESDDPIETAFQLLVPDSGKANTVAGEAVRAMMRILYRDWNDGDRFFEGYGIETCADSVAYLCDQFEDLYSDFAGIAERNLEEDAYSNALKKVSDKLLDILYKDPELFTKENAVDSRDYDGADFIEAEGWQPEYEIDVTMPDNVYYHLEKGDVSETDIQWELESWEGCSDADIEVNSDYVYFHNIDKATYDDIESYGYRWLEQYGESLDDEYGSEEDEEYDEDHEEYFEEEEEE